METDQPLPPTTTAQQDITTAGQRRINLIWEFTQGTIAVLITLAIIYLGIINKANKTLEDAFIMIITMYFVRTNHSIIGGIGPKIPGQSR
jgi:hypothetical protein